jgi:ATP-dependent DNA helicase RecG
VPDSIEIINPGGPERSVKLDDLRKGIIRNPRSRNRRIGDFLKELDMTEGRGTGIPIIRKEMKNNGSPEPRFETGDDYSYFITTLPIHPVFLENETLNEKEDEIQISDNKYNTLFHDINGAINKRQLMTLAFLT